MGKAITQNYWNHNEQPVTRKRTDKIIYLDVRSQEFKQAQKVNSMCRWMDRIGVIVEFLIFAGLIALLIHWAGGCLRWWH